MGIVWFDAHADFNTPETTNSGFLDGMGLAIAVGHCWRSLSRTVEGFRPVREGNVVLVGGRGASPAEKERLSRSGETIVEGRRVHEVGGSEALGDALEGV